jgi:hypothetical protein
MRPLGGPGQRAGAAGWGSGLGRRAGRLAEPYGCFGHWFQPEPLGIKARDSESKPAGARGHAAQTLSPAGQQAPRLGCAAANAGRCRGPWGARLGSWEEGPEHGATVT